MDRESFGQRFIITVIRYSTGVGLENTWTTNLDYNFYILRGLYLKRFVFRLLFILLDLDLKNLDYEFGLRLLDSTGFGLGNTWPVI